MNQFLNALLHLFVIQSVHPHGRSLNKEVIATLEGALYATPIDADAIRDRARSVRETMGVYMTEQELTSLKKEGRKCA